MYQVIRRIMTCIFGIVISNIFWIFEYHILLRPWFIEVSWGMDNFLSRWKFEVSFGDKYGVGYLGFVYTVFGYLPSVTRVAPFKTQPLKYASMVKVCFKCTSIFSNPSADKSLIFWAIFSFLFSAFRLMFCGNLLICFFICW